MAAPLLFPPLGVIVACGGERKNEKRTRPEFTAHSKIDVPYSNCGVMICSRHLLLFDPVSRCEFMTPREVLGLFSCFFFLLLLREIEYVLFDWLT